jgi:hypothetical protein
VNIAYDVFEVLPNRSLTLRACVRGTQRALEALKAVGSRTMNECFATDPETREVIGRVNNERSAVLID